jgi:hypothetical protein
MTNDEMTKEAQMTNDEKAVTALPVKLVIRVSLFLRHSTFVLRRVEANVKTPERLHCFTRLRHSNP